MTDVLQSTVAAEIRAEMARQHVTQAELGSHLGLTQPAVSKRLTGKRDFTVGELGQVAELLNVPVTSLLARAA